MPTNTFFNLSEKTRQRIIDAAYDEYLSKSYEEVTVRSLVSRAKIPIGSFYRYFSDKDELYIYLLGCIAEKAVNTVDNLLNYFEYPPEIDESKYLTEREYELQSKFYETPSEVIMRFYFDNNKQRIRDMYEKALEQAKQRGELRDGIDIKLTSFMYSTTLYNLFLYFKENNITTNIERWKIMRKFYFEFFTYSILKHPDQKQV